MSGSSQSYYGASPSVTKERWLKHAVHKLSKGYILIVNSDRKVANFYKGYGDFESCSFQTARELINGGFVEEDGDDPMGIVYTLKSDKDIDITTSEHDDEDEEDDSANIDTEAALEEEEANLDEELEDNEEADIDFEEE